MGPEITIKPSRLTSDVLYQYCVRRNVSVTNYYLISNSITPTIKKNNNTCNIKLPDT